MGADSVHDACGHLWAEHHERGCFHQSEHGSGCCTCGVPRPTVAACPGCISRDAALEEMKKATRKDRDTLLAIKDLVNPKKPETAT